MSEQGSAEWLFERVGLVTASRFKDVMGRGSKGAYLAGRETYLWEVIVERLTGQPTDHFTNAAMTWGSEQELFARMDYEARTGLIVEEVGLIKHATLQGVGGSPDGLIEGDGGIEIKCPFNSAVHLRTILTGMPPEHAPQVQGLMWITGRAWWDFVSFDPRLPAPLNVYTQRIERDEPFIALMEAEVITFLTEVDARIELLKEGP